MATIVDYVVIFTIFCCIASGVLRFFYYWVFSYTERRWLDRILNALDS